MPKYQYKENQWSPLNPEGKKQYDRAFLITLQTEPMSLQKPKGLPNLDIIKDTPLQHKLPNLSSPPSGQTPAIHRNQHDLFLPQYVRSSGGSPRPPIEDEVIQLGPGGRGYASWSRGWNTVEGGGNCRSTPFNIFDPSKLPPKITKKLEFTVHHDIDQSQDKRVSAEEAKKVLDKLESRKKTENEEIFDWIDENIGQVLIERPRYIRALVTAVAESAIIMKKGQLEVDTKIFKDRITVLKKYLDNKEELEIQALYALQALVNKLQHPQGMLVHIFNMLYDEKAISEDAFFQWERSNDQNEQEGKEVAVKSVTSFLTWLLENGWNTVGGGVKSRATPFNIFDPSKLPPNITKKLELAVHHDVDQSRDKRVSAEEAKKVLDKLLESRKKTGNEELVDWIDANIGEVLIQTPPYIRALVTAVTESAITMIKGQHQVDTKIFKDRITVLKKYLDNKEELEIQALYALQALVNKLQHPRGMLVHIFNTLFDEEAMSEDAFFQWERSNDQNEQEGKEVAVKSVTSFFTWLQEADEESVEEN